MQQTRTGSNTIHDNYLARQPTNNVANCLMKAVHYPRIVRLVLHLPIVIVVNERLQHVKVPIVGYLHHSYLHPAEQIISFKGYTTGLIGEEDAAPCFIILTMQAVGWSHHDVLTGDDAL